MKFYTPIVAAIVVVAATSVAFADNIGQQQGQAQAQGQGQLQEQRQQQGQTSFNKNTNVNKNANFNASSSRSAAGAAAGAAAFNKGNDVNTSVNVAGDDIDPPAYAPNVSLTSSHCIGSAGGSGGGLGLFSVGFAMTTEVVNCFKIEVWKGLIGSKRFDEADKLLNSIDWYKEAMATPSGTATLQPTTTVAVTEPKRKLGKAENTDQACVYTPDLAEAMGLNCIK